MHYKTKLLLAAILITAVAAITYAQERGPGLPLASQFDVILQINDARAAYGFGPNYTICTPWPKGLVHSPPYSFAAGKKFILIIRDMRDNTPYPSEYRNITAVAVANETGFVYFKVKAAPTDVTQKSDWYVAILVEWPAAGIYFLVYENSFKNAMFIDVIGNLTGRPELNGTKIYNGTWGAIKITNGEGHYGNLSSSYIHTFYVGINTVGKQFDLTFTRVIEISSARFTLDDKVRPATGPSNYVKMYDPNVQYVFGPFTYLGAYVKDIGGIKKTVTVDSSKVTLKHYVDLNIEGAVGTVIYSENSIFDPIGKLRYVAKTLNKTAGPGTGYTVPMSCNLVIWNMTLYKTMVKGMLDLKGNPIFNPEDFRFKIQTKLGGVWVTFDRAQPTWRLTLGDVKAVLNQVCGTITSFNDIMSCYRRLGPDGFRSAVLALYDTSTLVRLGGQLKLTDDSSDISLADVLSKLVVEYSYTAQRDTVKAIVLEAALAERGDYGPVVLNVSVLPVQIRLWRWSNNSLPPAVPNPREYFYTDPLDLASLRFVVTGDTMYIDRAAYDGAVTYDPWLGQVIWTLPPYQPVPGLVGNVKATLLTWFNASGYLPLPPLLANLTKSAAGGLTLKYYNYTDAPVSFFAKYDMSLVKSYGYKFRIYSNDVLVGTANVIAQYPVVNKSGLLFHANASEALYAIYDDNQRTDMYSVQIVQPGRFYDREHVIHIAIARILQNILLRDACGNPIQGIAAGLAGASISLVMEIGGKNVTIATLPLGSEVPVDIMVPIDEWGNPQLNLGGDYIEAYAVLNYFGYKLYPADNITKIPASQPQPFKIRVKTGPVRKPVLYLPISPLLFRVWSQAVSADYDPLKEPLMGFVVIVSSTAGKYDIAQSISNKDGYAYEPYVPIGVPFAVKVRTIVPRTDKVYPYTYEQMSRGNDYASYAKYLGFSPISDVYTLGTRGKVDSGMVVYEKTLIIDSTNASKYICAKNAIDLPVEVYDLVVRVYDKTGKYLLRSQPVFLGPYPQATRPILMNVTLVLAGGTYREASIWRNITLGDFKILTDFNAIGITGMRSIYMNLASNYLGKAQKSLGCPTYYKPNYADAINAYALAAMAGFIANASTDRYAAVYLLTSNQPKDNIDLCAMKDYQAGAADIARLFMKGQRLRFIVWYLGQKVFDDYVTITGPVVNIYTDVVPVNVTTYTKSMRLPVDTFVGFTLTDVYVGLFLNKTDGMFANKSVAPMLVKPFDQMFKLYSLQYLLANELKLSNASIYNDRVDILLSNGTTKSMYYGYYTLPVFGGDFVYLPNVAVIRNASVPKYLYTVVRDGRLLALNFGYKDTMKSGSIEIPASQTFRLTLVGSEIAIDPNSNSTYMRLTARVTPGSTTWQQLIGYGDLVVIDGKLVKNYVLNLAANYTIDVTVNAPCGDIQIRPAPNDITVDLSITSGKCKASITYTAVNRTYYNITVVPGTEFAVSFDRWFKVTYDWNYKDYGVLYHSNDIVERRDVLGVLTASGGEKCATQKGVTPRDQDDEYTYELTLRGLDVVNYRTLYVKVPWRIQGDARVEVNITAYFAKNNTKIDSKVYNLTVMLNGTKANEAEALLPLNFGKVAEKAYAIATTDTEVKYVIKFYMYRPKTGPTKVCATKLAPLAGNYTTVSMYECTTQRPGPPIDPATVIYGLDKARSIDNGFGITFDKYGGFGTPITYVVKSGEVALLPSWYSKTSVYGSRIARIWLIAASDDPSKGPALGTYYYKYTISDDKVSINVYKFWKYLVVNYVPNVCPAGFTSTTMLDEFDGSGRIIGLGFGTGGTSTLIISNYTKVRMWNATDMWLAGGVFRLPTVALDAVTVQNDADFPIVVTSVDVKYRDYTYNIAATPVRIEAQQTGTALLRGYGFGRTYMFNISDVWSFRLVQPNYQYSVSVYHAGLADAARYYGLGDVDVTKYLAPIRGRYVAQNVLYASHAERGDWTYNILNGKIAENTTGTWSKLNVRSNDTDYKYAFTFPALPLKEIRDWNDRPLANQTIALFDRSGKLYALVYSDSRGRLAYPLPDISAIGLTNVVRVSWYNGYLVELLRGKPEFTIWIYDQLTQRDVTELGDASTNSKIRTYVYPLTATVRDDAGRPLTNMYVKVIDVSTLGQLVNAANKTGADGSAQVVDLRISKYSSGVMSQVPATSYYYYVYDQSGALVALGKFEIQRGASVPSTGYNVVATVRYATEIPVKNSATRGYLLIKGVEFLNGSKLNVTVPFTISGGVMMLQGKVPVSVEYPVDIYVTHVTLGGQEVQVKGGKLLVFRGKTTDLLAGFDFAELGLTSLVNIQAVDSSGSPRADWTIQVLYNDTRRGLLFVVAQGAGQVQAVLPRSDVLEGKYILKVITNAYMPDGERYSNTSELSVRQKVLQLQIPIRTVRVVVQVVDGFGNVRNDWPVEIVNVTSGMGQISTELVEGKRYEVRATGLGHTDKKSFVATGPQMVYRIMIATGKIIFSVVDGFGNIRNDWPIEIVNVVAGQGKVEVEVLANRSYTVRTTVFGREFTKTVEVPAGQVVTGALQVPTAKLSIIVVDDDKKPIDQYVTSVEISGSLLPKPLQFASPPKDFELLAGEYTVTVNALGRTGSAKVTLGVGNRTSLAIVVTGTAGLDLFGTRIPLPTLVLYSLLLLVVVLILAIIVIEYNNWRRRRLMQILAPPK